jgi:hypothetical protein
VTGSNCGVGAGASLPRTVLLEGSIGLTERVSNACNHFCNPIAEYRPGLEGISRFEAYPRTEQDQSFQDKSSLHGTRPSELQNRVHQFNSGRGRRSARSGSGARGLAGRRPRRCNASMIIRRLIAWFRFQRPQPLQQLTVLAAARDQKTEFDLAEFGRLLSSGRREDLKKIAQVMSQPADRVR